MYWSEDGGKVVIACEDSYYVLSVNMARLNECLDRNDADGAQACFETLDEVNEAVKTASWVGDCFLYTNGGNR